MSLIPNELFEYTYLLSNKVMIFFIKTLFKTFFKGVQY